MTNANEMMQILLDQVVSAQPALRASPLFGMQHRA
jgi:hypothetical protein